MRSRESFNKAAELYDQVRPTYPNELIDWVIEKSNLDLVDSLLEIAPGTGQCTRKFAERNFKIHAVELGDKLAAILRENMTDKKVTVDIAPFEEWIHSSTNKYRLIYCATAWHWIDPEVKYKKTYDLLEDNGRLAIIWNNALGTIENKIMDEAYKLLFSYHKETPHSTKPKTQDEIKMKSLGTKGMLEESGYFILDDYFEKTWSFQQPREKAIKGFYSQSSFLSLCENDQNELKEKLEILFRNLDNELEAHFKSVVYLCKKRLD